MMPPMGAFMNAGASPRLGLLELLEAHPEYLLAVVVGVLVFVSLLAIYDQTATRAEEAEAAKSRESGDAR